MTLPGAQGHRAWTSMCARPAHTCNGVLKVDHEIHHLLQTSAKTISRNAFLHQPSLAGNICCCCSQVLVAFSWHHISRMSSTENFTRMNTTPPGTEHLLTTHIYGSYCCIFYTSIVTCVELLSKGACWFGWVCTYVGQYKNSKEASGIKALMQHPQQIPHDSLRQLISLWIHEHRLLHAHAAEYGNKIMHQESRLKCPTIQHCATSYMMYK